MASNMRIFISMLLVAMAHTFGSGALAQNAPTIPNFWDPQERFIKPNVRSLPRMRFLTTTDFPPFSFIDRDKRLVGFHVDLARAICAELEILPVCQIQAVPFADLEKEIIDGNGDAVLAGMAKTAQNRQKFSFSRTYFRIPSRFVAKRGSGFSEPLLTALAGKTVGIVDGTAQAAFAKNNFEQLQLRLFATQDAAFSSLQKGEVSALFDDGLSLSFRLQRIVNDQKCCEFVGEPYLSDRYFGSGLTVAMKQGNLELENAINFALRSINDKGIFAELYLRYFPISIY